MPGGSPYLPIRLKSFEENVQTLLGRAITQEEQKIVKWISDHENSIARQEGNVYRYIISQVPLDRGKRIQYEILKGAAQIGASRAAIIESIRNQLDKKLVPANFWGEKREDSNSEKHQYRVMKALEWIASCNLSTNPVRYIRQLRERAIPLLTLLKQNKTSISTQRYAEFAADAMKETSWKMALQLGIGNCGEHSHVSFETLKALIESDPQKYLPILKNIIRTDLQNGDHAFVLGGFVVEKLFYDSKNGGSLFWKLDDQLKRSEPQEPGFVLDTYIEEIHSMTAVDFKKYLERQSHSTGADPIIYQMHWLEQYPAPIPKDIVK